MAYKNPLDLADDIQKDDDEVNRIIKNAAKQDEAVLKKYGLDNREGIITRLKEFGYTDEEISKFGDEDFNIAADFFGRFNNPHPRKD